MWKLNGSFYSRKYIPSTVWSINTGPPTIEILISLTNMVNI